MPLPPRPSVASHGAVDFDTISVDSSLKVCHALESRREETSCAVDASHTSMAVDDRFARSVERIDVRLELAKRDQKGSR